MLHPERFTAVCREQKLELTMSLTALCYLGGMRWSLVQALCCRRLCVHCSYHFSDLAEVQLLWSPNLAHKKEPKLT